MAINLDEWLQAQGETFELFIGEDVELVFPVYNAEQTAILDINGWALSFMVKRHLGDQDARALLVKSTDDGITISGDWDADPEANEQVARVSIEDVDTDALVPGVYPYELKRMDPGFEAVIAFGVVPVKRGVHRS
jgi:hypothetical protein